MPLNDRPEFACPINRQCQIDGVSCELEPHNADPFTPAERLCLSALYNHIDAFRASEWQTLYKNSDQASYWVETALCTGDPNEAEAAFEQADTLYASIIENTPDPTTEFGMRAVRDREFLPVFRMRRQHAPHNKIAMRAYEAIGNATHTVLSNFTNFHTRRRLVGILSENCVAGLLARRGYIPYPTSSREGKGDNTRLNCDFKVVGRRNGLLSLEVKNKSMRDREPYDPRIMVLLYGDVCRELGEQTFDAHERPKINDLALDIAEALVKEAGLQQMTDYDTYILNIACNIIEEKITEWENQCA